MSRPGFKDDLDTFSEEKAADVVVIMTLTSDPEGSPVRHIAVYSENRIFKEQVCICNLTLNLLI